MRDVHQMSQAQTIGTVRPVQSRMLVMASEKAVSIPRTIWVMASGMFLAAGGGAWDFAWHASIGRDTAFTPAHITMWIGALLFGTSSLYTIFAATFGSEISARDFSVRTLGLRAPGGAFLVGWGSLALFAAAPIDSWWHNAYGIDVGFISPPHMLGFLGTLVAKIGAIAWIASIINRSDYALQLRLRWMFLVLGTIGMGELSVGIMVPTWSWNMHTAACYLFFAIFIPSIMIATGWGSRHKWGCTIVGGLYMAIGMLFEWVLPLFPAQPKLGPVYHNVTHLIPLRFPLLLIAPGLVADLLLQRLPQRSSWLKALWVGPALVLGFLAAQWPFANFLMSPASRNWVFGTAYFAYLDTAGTLYDPYKFKPTEPFGAFVFTMMLALAISILTTYLGLAWGDWMRRIRR